jgi:hypothetical protein
MLQGKYMSTRERVLRLAVGIMLALCGLVVFGPGLLGWASLASGVVTAATGVIGFCPSCAVPGRRSAKRSESQ